MVDQSPFQKNASCSNKQPFRMQKGEIKKNKKIRNPNQALLLDPKIYIPSLFLSLAQSILQTYPPRNLPLKQQTASTPRPCPPSAPTKPSPSPAAGPRRHRCVPVPPCRPCPLS